MFKCLSSCLCGLTNLRNGTIIIGSFWIALSAVLVILSIYQLIFTDSLFFGSFFFISLICSCLLIFGAVREKRLFLLPWLFLTIATTVVLIIYTIRSAITQPVQDLVYCILVIGILIPFLFLYPWLIVLNYHRVMHEEERRLFQSQTSIV